MKRLDGKVAVVTGASMGMGKAIALALASEGANLAIVARREGPLGEAAEEMRALGVQVLSCTADIADSDSVDAMVESVLERYGRLDILVNNAGVNMPNRTLADITPQDWKTTVDVNLTGAFLCTRAVLPTMRSLGQGTIANVSSGSGRRASIPAGVAYSASKAALSSFNESINLAERKNGVRACLIIPGEVNTPHVMKRLYPPSSEARAIMLQPEDVAAAVLFVVTMPQRATVEELVLMPTVRRNRDDDAKAALGQR